MKSYRDIGDGADDESVSEIRTKRVDSETDICSGVLTLTCALTLT